jgi:hypothetical protein
MEPTGFLCELKKIEKQGGLREKMPSKAQEYKERLAKLSAPKFLLNDDDGRKNFELASVNPDGYLRLRNIYIDANEALRLGKWLIEWFGDNDG